MAVGKRQFTLIGMEHRRGVLPKIMRALDENFKRGDRVAFELSQPEIDMLKALLPTLKAGHYVMPDPTIVRRLPVDAQTILSELLGPFRPIKSRVLTEKEKNRSKKNRQKRITTLKKGFSCVVIERMLDKGIIPIGIDSYFGRGEVVERWKRQGILGKGIGAGLGGASMLAIVPTILLKVLSVGALILAATVAPAKSEIIDTVLREKRFVKRILKDPTLAGGFFGDAHAKIIKRRLQQAGVEVKFKRLISLHRKLFFAPLDNLHSKAAYTRYNLRKRARQKRRKLYITKPPL